MTDRKLTVSFGGASNLAEITKVEQLSWSQFAAMLTAPPPVTEDKTVRGWYCPVSFNPVYRDSENFQHRYALTLDYDHIETFDLDDILETFAPYAHVWYTTFSHTPEKPRIRVVMPLSRPATYDEFQAVSRKVAHMVGIELAARESHKPSQMMFLPTRKADVEFESEINSGAWLDVDAILAQYENWTDKSTWPHRSQGDGVHSSDLALTPPTEKPGVIGAFCRAYNIVEAIATFELPYVPTSNPDRYTFTDGSRPEGAILYDDGQKLHSHHDTDPAAGQAHSFDLVRLHLFGEQDQAVPSETPIADRPSFKAMVDFARADPKVIAELKVDASKEFERTESDELFPVADMPGAAVPEGTKPERFAVVPPSTYLNAPPVAWHIKNLVPDAAIAVMFGRPGSGKSFIGLDMAGAVSRGVDWRGIRTKPGLVVIVAAEAVGGFMQRMKAYQREHNVPPEDMPGLIADTPNFREVGDAVAVAKSVRNWAAGRRVSLIIVDTLAASTPGSNENSSEDMGAAIHHCKEIHRSTGATVMLIHHTGKDITKGARGWSGLLGAVDAEIEVSRTGDYRLLSVTKMKDGGDNLQLGFKLRTVNLGVDEDGDAITSCVVEHTNEAPPVEKSNKPLGDVLARVYRIAVECLMDGEQLNTSQLCGKMAPSFPNDGDMVAAGRRLMGPINKLIASGHLYFENGLVRVTQSQPVSSEDFLE